MRDALYAGPTLALVSGAGTRASRTALLRDWRARSTRDCLPDGRAALEEGTDLFIVGSHGHKRVLVRGAQEKNFFGRDARVGKQGGRVGADEDLASALARRFPDHGGQVSDDSLVQREFRLLEEEWTCSVNDGPEETNQPQRPIGELIFGLPPCIRSPMLVQPSQVWPAGLVPLEPKVLQLWNGHAKCFVDAPEA